MPRRFNWHKINLPVSARAAAADSAPLWSWEWLWRPQSSPASNDREFINLFNLRIFATRSSWPDSLRLPTSFFNIYRRHSTSYRVMTSCVDYLTPVATLSATISAFCVGPNVAKVAQLEMLTRQSLFFLFHVRRSSGNSFWPFNPFWPVALHRLNRLPLSALTILAKCVYPGVVHSKKSSYTPKKNSKYRKKSKKSQDFFEDFKSVHLIWEWTTPRIQYLNPFSLNPPKPKKNFEKSEKSEKIRKIWKNPKNPKYPKKIWKNPKNRKKSEKSKKTEKNWKNPKIFENNPINLRIFLRVYTLFGREQALGYWLNVFTL